MQTISRFQISFDKFNNFSFLSVAAEIRWRRYECILFWNEMKWNYGSSIKKFGLIDRYFFSLTVSQFTDNRRRYVGCCAKKSNSGLLLFNNNDNKTHICTFFSSVVPWFNFISILYFISSSSPFYSTFPFHITCDALLIQFSSASQRCLSKYSIFNLIRNATVIFILKLETVFFYFCLFYRFTINFLIRTQKRNNWKTRQKNECAFLKWMPLVV